MHLAFGTENVCHADLPHPVRAFCRARVLFLFFTSLAPVQAGQTIAAQIMLWASRQAGVRGGDKMGRKKVERGQVGGQWGHKGH